MFKESIAIALRALLANKLRSILTMLGIIIGVGAVIAMVSVGLGVREKVQNSIASLGSNLLIVTPGAASSQGVRSAAGSNTTLLPEDAEYIKKTVQDITYVAPSVSQSYQTPAIRTGQPRCRALCRTIWPFAVCRSAAAVLFHSRILMRATGSPCLVPQSLRVCLVK